MTTLNQTLKELLKAVQSSHDLPSIIKEDARNDFDYLEHNELSQEDMEDMIEFYEEVLQKIEKVQ